MFGKTTVTSYRCSSKIRWVKLQSIFRMPKSCYSWSYMLIDTLQRLPITRCNTSDIYLRVELTSNEEKYARKARRHTLASDISAIVLWTDLHGNRLCDVTLRRWSKWIVPTSRYKMPTLHLWISTTMNCQYF